MRRNDAVNMMRSLLLLIAHERESLAYDDALYPD